MWVFESGPFTSPTAIYLLKSNTFLIKYFACFHRHLKRNQTVFCEFYFKQEQITFSATLNQPQLVWTLICPISDNVSPRRRLFRHTCPTPEVVHWPELLAKDVWGLLEPRCWTFQSSSTGPASGRGRSDRPDSIRPRRFLAWSVFSRDPTFFSFDVDDQA